MNESVQLNAETEDITRKWLLILINCSAVFDDVKANTSIWTMSHKVVLSGIQLSMM